MSWCDHRVYDLKALSWHLICCEISPDVFAVLQERNREQFHCFSLRQRECRFPPGGRGEL